MNLTKMWMDGHDLDEEFEPFEPIQTVTVEKDPDPPIEEEETEDEN